MIRSLGRIAWTGHVLYTIRTTGSIAEAAGILCMTVPAVLYHLHRYGTRDAARKALAREVSA